MDFWYSKPLTAYLLLPLSWLFGLISGIRRRLFTVGLPAAYRAPVPVIVVGNLSVGGNGKTPVVIWLTEQLQQRGFTVGVISRGYGGCAKTYPLLVTGHSDPVQAGDEPVLIAERTGAPVCVAPERRAAVELLLQQQPCDVIISDDGLQHYKLQRDIEIVVMDAQRGFGNGFLLPAGPLRELPTRLSSVDLVIANGRTNDYADAEMRLVPHYAVNLVTGEKRPLAGFNDVSAVAGIGNPQRFFTMLRALNIRLSETRAFSDHQRFNAELLTKFTENRPLFMTEKDAVKCRAFARPHWWYVPVEAEITGNKATELLNRIEGMIK